MSAQSDYDGIQFKTMIPYLDGETLGAIKKGSLELGLAGSYVLLEDVDGFEGVFKAWSRATIGSLRMTVKTSSLQFLVNRMLAGQVDANIKGAYLGSKDRDLVDIAGELLLHPKGTPFDSRLEDVKLWNVVIRVDIAILFGGDVPPEYPIELIVLPDINREAGKEFGFIGDWSYIEAAPLGVIIGSDREARHPLLSETALTLINGQIMRKKAFLIHGEASTITLDIDNVAGYTGTDTGPIAFDNLSAPNSLVAGMYLKTGTGGTLQYWYITGVTYSTTTAGTFNCVRDVVNHNTQAVVDGETLTVMQSIGASACIADVRLDVERGRDKVDWASDNAAVKSGDEFMAADYTDKKGVLSYVSGSGSANITATASGVSSPNLAVTTI
jgi:hypothetical protein